MEKNEKLLDQLKQRLQQRYLENTNIKRLFYPEHPLSLDDCYLHLGLTQKSALELAKNSNKFNDSYTFDQRNLHLRGFERSVSIEKTLEVNDIATTYLPKQKRIMIEGPAGSGKTTLCRYIAYQWALEEQSKELWAKQYDWLFWIPLRQLSSLPYESLYELICSECFGLNEFENLTVPEKEQLMHEIKIKPDKILWLLDGYDELNLSQPSVHKLWNSLQSLKQIVLTTRPGRPMMFNPPFKLQLAVLGLSDRQIENYITNFFSQAPIQSPDMAKDCYKFILTNSNLWSLCHSPINLEMICSLWDQRALNSEKKINLTDLYQLIFEHLLLRYVRKLKPEKLWTVGSAKQYCSEEIEFMEYLAFFAMQKEIVFIQDEALISKALKKINIHPHVDPTPLEDIEKLGLLNFYHNGQQAEFAHLTFQEFFAARYIKKQLLAYVESPTSELHNFEQLLRFIQNKKHEPFYEVMWWFVAGLLAQKPGKPFLIDIKPQQEVLRKVSRNQLKLNALQLWIDCVLQPPRSGKDELNDVCLLMRCLDEAKYPNIMQKPAIIALFQNWLSFYLDNYSEISEFFHGKLPFQLRQIESCLQPSGPSLYQQLVIRRYLHKLIESGKPELLRSLTGLNIWRTLQSAWLTSNETPNEKSLSDLLLSFLSSKDTDVQTVAMQAIEMLGVLSTQELQLGILPLLQHENEAIRQAAVKVIGSFGSAADEQLKQALVPFLQDKNEQIQKEAIATVGRLREAATQELQSGLLPLLNSTNAVIQQAAIEAVKTIGQATHEDVQQALVLLLQHKNEAIQQTTVEAVSRLREEVTKELQLGLLPLFEDTNKSIQQATIEAVKKIGLKPIHSEIKQVLVLLLKHNNPDVSQIAASLVIELEKVTPEELQDLFITLIENKKSNTKELAKGATKEDRLNPENQENKLEALLNYENSIVLERADKAFKEIIHVVQEKLKLPDSLFSSDDLHNLFVMIKNVNKINSAAPKNLDSFLPLLNHQNPDIQIEAVRAVGELGESAPEKLQQALVPLMKHENLHIQIEAIRIINKLEEATIGHLQQLLEIYLTSEDSIEQQEKAIWLIYSLQLKINKHLKDILINLINQPNREVSRFAAICLLSVDNDITYLKQPFEIHTLQLPPSQIFDWTEEKVQQLVPLCGEMQKSILQREDVQHVLTADYWTLALVRKKDRQHVFLLLEGVQDAIHFAKKIELVLPDSSGSSFINPNYAEIRVENIEKPEDFISLKKLSENCECQIYSITAEIGNQLIGNTKVDQEAKIYYNFSGDGRAYSFSFFNEERHNCLSWCLKQLQAVGIPLKRHWLDVVCVIPVIYLPNTKQEITPSRCVIS